MSHAQAAAADAPLVNGTAAAEAHQRQRLAETFDSKAGNDTITGGSGEDIYIYRTGYGNDTIIEDDNFGETDTLKLRDLTPSQITLLQAGNDLVITINPTGEPSRSRTSSIPARTTGYRGNCLQRPRDVWNGRRWQSSQQSKPRLGHATLLAGGIEESTVNGAWWGRSPASIRTPARRSPIRSPTMPAAGSRSTPPPARSRWRTARCSNYEAATSHDVTVRVTDQGGLTFDKTFTHQRDQRQRSADQRDADRRHDRGERGQRHGGRHRHRRRSGCRRDVHLFADRQCRRPLCDQCDHAARSRSRTARCSTTRAATSHDVTVRVTDQGGLTFDKAFTINVTNVNEAPTNATLTGGTIAENAANGTVVGTVAGVDPDAGATLSYSLTDNAGGRFAINSTTGQITVANGTLLELRERDLARRHGAGHRPGRADLRQGLHHQRDQRQRGADQRDAVGRHRSPRTRRTAPWSAPSPASIRMRARRSRYSLTDNAGGRFAINATTGQITVANGTLLNYESRDLARHHGAGHRPGRADLRQGLHASTSPTSTRRRPTRR